MDSKLELLLDKINLDTEDYKNFEDGKILKIISSKDKLNWNFILEVKDLLPISSLEKLDEIKEAFPDLKSVTYTLKIEGITNAKVNDYYSYVINSLKLGKGIAMIFLNKEIRFTTNGMVLEASNKAEENVINSKIKDIEKKYKQIGFSKFSLNTELVEEKDNTKEIAKEIKEEAKEAIEEYNHKPVKQVHDRTPMASTKKIEDSNAILGMDITDEASKIETVTGEMQDVTIEGYVFGKELFESTKSAFKIITLKVSDLSDSILVKVFFKNEDDFHRIDGQLKENNWYKINGRVSFDTFANDLVLSARNIMEIESKFTEIN